MYHVKQDRTYRQYLVAIVVVLISFSGIAQNNDCVAAVSSYLDQMSTVGNPEEGKTYYLKYTTQVKYNKEARLPNVETTSEIIMGNQKQVVKDSNMKVFADGNDVFVIIPQNKLIYWNDSDPRIFEETNAYGEFLEMEKALLQSGEVSCSVKDGSMRITVVPSRNVTNRLFLSKQLIVFNTSLNRIEKVTNYFNNKSKISEQTTHYEIIDYDSKKSFKRSSKNYVFASGKLQTEYNGFKLIDNRTKE